MQEEDFSSQNVNPTVSSISESPIGYGYLLSDGTSFFVHISRKSDLDLKVEDEVTEDALQLIEEISQFSSAIIQAMKYLNFRGHSRKELEVKLMKKNCPAKAIGDVCISLIERGLLDDGKYAENYISSCIRKGRYSINEISARLQSKGISRDIIHSVLDKQYTEEESIRALNFNIEKLMRNKKNTRKKIIASLQRKGFRYKDIADALENLTGSE